MQQQRRSLIAIAIILALVVISGVGLTRAVAQLTAQARTQAAQQRTDKPTNGTPTVTVTKPVLPGLAIQGTQIVDANGKVVTLIGASRSSLEYLCSGDGHFQPADFQAMRAWGMNVVRLPLSSEFWANRGDVCPTYRQTVTAAVYNAEHAGLYVILDLQWNAPFDTAYDRQHGGVQCAMPDTDKDAAMWRDIAMIYQHDQAVLFDLFGEPHDVNWNVWFGGGSVTNQCYEINGNATKIEPGTYQAIGMRDLVGQMRALAPNVVILSGVDWGYNLTGIDVGNAFREPNILYGTHPFDYASKAPALWNRDFGNLSAQYPVIATEFGAYDCGTGYISQAIQYFTAHHMSWLAWSWGIGGCGGPSLIADWNGTPSASYGQYIHDQMVAATKG